MSQTLKETAVIMDLLIFNVNKKGKPNTFYKNFIAELTSKINVNEDPNKMPKRTIKKRPIWRWINENWSTKTTDNNENDFGPPILLSEAMNADPDLGRTLTHVGWYEIFGPRKQFEDTMIDVPIRRRSYSSNIFYIRERELYEFLTKWRNSPLGNGAPHGLQLHF